MTHCLRETLTGAHVAPQRCTILRSGKAALVNTFQDFTSKKFNCPHSPVPAFVLLLQCQHFMLYNKLDHVIIDESFLLLECI